MNGSPDEHVVITDHTQQEATIAFIDIPQEKVTIADIRPGTFFIHCGTVYLKLHHKRDHCEENHVPETGVELIPCLDICIPNYDYDASKKVTSACVAMDGSGWYFPDIMEVDAVPLGVEIRVLTSGYKEAE